MTAGELLTPWFPAGSYPARDGVYLTRQPDCECWHAMRWHGATRTWYGADTSGTDQSDVIGWDYANAYRYDWRGLAFDPAL